MRDHSAMQIFLTCGIRALIRLGRMEGEEK